MNWIKNPIITGFNPDPSIIRVGEDYYIATSTFEWFPGVQIHHSKDLINWRLVARPLNRTSQLDLKGVRPSAGVWAPCLTHHDGVFYLVYTVVRSFYCNMRDMHNYLVTATDINGEWSDPIYLHSYGFDPSLFHDDDQRKYIVTKLNDHRVSKRHRGHLVLQEYDENTKKMIGSPRDIFVSDEIFLEGSHIYKRNGYYYLFSADTGTGEGHGQSILRSTDIYGPYEWYEGNSIMTTRDNPEYPLQKTGHSDLVETQNGDWFMVYLCGRPLNKRNPADSRKAPNERRYTLGREVGIAKVEWTEDGWLRLANGTKLPELQLKNGGLALCTFPKDSGKDHFDSLELNINYQFSRIPLDERFYSLSERRGWLRLYGREGLSSCFEQSLIVRRWQSFKFTAETRLEFEPRNFMHMAGLVCLYDVDNYYYVHVTNSEDQGKCIGLSSVINKYAEEPSSYISIGDGEVCFRVVVEWEKLQFYYAVGDEDFKAIGPSLDASCLSDEGCVEGWFSGAMVGICCQDLQGTGVYADFDMFDYREW